MTKREVSFSDLSGQMGGPDGELVPLVVTDAPDLDQPVRIEVTPDEMERIGKVAIAAVSLETEPAEEDAPRARYVVPVGKLAALATVGPLDQVLASAEPVTPKRRSHSTTKNGEPLNDHNALEWAGTPHKGKTGAEEARLVREHLDEINVRLASQGHRTIDPNNPEHAKRYGFDTVVDQA